MTRSQLIICLLWTCVFVPAGFAQEQATVRLDGRPVFRVGAQEGQSAAQRAARIERRLSVLVPNAEIFTSRVTNNTASPVRRGTASLFLGYDADLLPALEAIRRGVVNADGVIEGRPVQVRIADLGQDDLEIEAQFWTDSRRSDHMTTASAVRESVLGELIAANIPLPNPDARVIFQGGTDGEKRTPGTVALGPAKGST